MYFVLGAPNHSLLVLKEKRKSKPKTEAEPTPSQRNIFKLSKAYNETAKPGSGQLAQAGKGRE